jgi:glycosyltransferase involved in cell wall biosynthesis
MSGVLFDGRWVRPGMTGVGIQAFNMLAAFAKLGVHAGLILNPGPVPPELAKGFTIITTTVDLTHHPKTELFEQFFIPFLCYRHGYTSFVSFEGRVPILHFGIRTFSYINDISYLNLKRTHNLKYTVLLIFSLLTSRLFASRMVAISHAVKDQLMKRLKTPEKRILVLHCADSGLDRFPEKALLDIPNPFFLGVGMTNPRKNLPCLLEGFEKFRRKHSSYSLVLTGHKDWIDSASAPYSTENVKNLGFISEGELLFLYRNAAGLIYPSKEEGFGIPLVDAWKFGCPIFCSDIPVFREIMGNHAEYFDNQSADDLAVKLQLSTAGRDAWKNRPPPPREYSWENTAQMLVAEIRKLSVTV